MTPAVDRHFPGVFGSIYEALPVKLVSLTAPLDDRLRIRLLIAPLVHVQGEASQALLSLELSTYDLHLLCDRPFGF